MKLAPLAVLVAMVVASCARAMPPAPPPWVSDKFELLERLKIDPSADLIEAANYHWSWTARREVVAGNYRCPAGSQVDVSRSIVVVRTPSAQACRGRSGDTIQMLKVLPDGSAQPMGGSGG